MFYKLKGNQKKKESKKKRHNKIKVFVPKTSKILKVAAASPRKKKLFLQIRQTNLQHYIWNQRLLQRSEKKSHKKFKKLQTIAATKYTYVCV